MGPAAPPYAGGAAAPSAPVRRSAELAHDLLRLVPVCLGVDFRREGHRVPEDDAGHLDAVALADAGGRRVPQSVRGPGRHLRHLAGPLDGLAVTGRVVAPPLPPLRI